MVVKILIGTAVATMAMMPIHAFGENAAVNTNQQAVATSIASPVAQVQPYRTFVTIQNYVMDSNGEPQNPISNVKLEVAFSKDKKIELPEGGSYWPVGNGQRQDINRTYEIPWEAISSDGFNFTIQMVRKGSKMLPCHFNVTQLSQYNRSYFCHTDVQWQLEKKLPEDRLDKEGVQVRVFTDKNTPSKELPKDALALR
jgi:hypothetical protein